MPEEPTLGEVVRRLDEVSRQLASVVHDIKDDRSQNAATYVRQDVYVAQRQADLAVSADLHGDVTKLKADLEHEQQMMRADFEREMQGLKEDRTRDKDFRRQVLLAFAIAGGGWVITLATFIVTFLAQK